MKKNRIKMLIATLFSFIFVFSMTSCSGSKYYDGEVCGEATVDGTNTFSQIRRFYVEQYVYEAYQPNKDEKEEAKYSIFSNKYVYDEEVNALKIVSDDDANYSNAHYLFTYYNGENKNPYYGEKQFNNIVKETINNSIQDSVAAESYLNDVVVAAGNKYYTKLNDMNKDSEDESAHNGAKLTPVSRRMQSHSKACIVFHDNFKDPETGITIGKTSWKMAWDAGFLTGLFVYPMAALINLFVKLFGGLTGNGLMQMFAILVVTIVIKATIFLLTFKSQTSTQKMQDIQPEMLALQAKYGQNPSPEQKQRMSMEMMALYKKYGVKPFAPFISLLITFPVFIAMYRAVMYLGVLRIGTLFGGVVMGNTLSSYIIGNFKVGALIIFLLMAASQILTMKLPQFLNSKRMTREAKEQQRKTNMMSNIMLIMILFMGFTMPVTMSIYWIASAIVSAAQSLVMHFMNNGGKKGRYKVKKDDNTPINIPQGVKTK